MSCTIARTHCESCGSTDLSPISSYSDCCNELIVDSSYCRDQHGHEARFQAAFDVAIVAAGYTSRSDFLATAGHEAFGRLSNQIWEQTS